MATCWCGNNSLARFSAAYGECSECGTLVSLQGMSPEELHVRDDESDFYGKQYWLSHQSADLGFPDIHSRARADLTERNLHWLRGLLKYTLPPANVMEIGCSHGSFVGLLQLAGYEAQGVELSPWVVDFGRGAFGVPISVGPVENLSIPKGSLDAIALMDVLEHLPDPAATMGHCLELLKPEGLLLIQTPQFREGMQYAHLLETKGAFLEQLKADEHLFLFSDRAAQRLFNQLGAPHLCFEPAIFSQYDMFFAVSRQPLRARGEDEIEEALLSTPRGRMALALLDMRRDAGKLDSSIAELTQYKASADEQVRTLTDWLLESRAENESVTRRQSDLDGQLVALTAMLVEAKEANAGLAAEKFEAESRIGTLTTLLSETQDEINALREAESVATCRIEHLSTELAAAARSLSTKEQLLNGRIVRLALLASRVLHRLLHPRIAGAKE